MKEIITKRMVEEVATKYVADDGKEFDNEFDCLMYEMQKNFKLLEIDYKRLVVCLFNFPFADWSTDTFTAEVVRLNSENDFYTLLAYHSQNSYHDSDFEKPTNYPCTKVVVSDEGYATFSSWSVSQVMEKLANAYNDAAKQLIANNVNFKEVM